MPSPTLNMKLGLVLLVVAFGISAPVLYGAALLVAPEEVEVVNGNDDFVPGEPVSVTLVAQNNLFDVRTIEASAGVEVTYTLENREAVIHNVAFYTSPAATTAIFVGEFITGPGVEVTETFTAPSTPGDYFFRCDAHPDTMTGQFIVR